MSMHLYYFMKGKYDYEWELSGQQPVSGTFTVKLLNQLHHSNYEVDLSIGKYTDGLISDDELFMPHRLLFSNGYLKNDSLQFRITYTDAKNSPVPCHKVTPVIIEMFNYTQKSEQQWYSNPFCFYWRIPNIDAVAATGCSISEGTHISVFLHLMKGPHDDELEQSGHWPLKGTFTIELLNQLDKNGRYGCKVVFTTQRNSQRVVKDKRSFQGWGFQRFITCDTLFHHKNNSYYKNDTLKFRISYEHLNPLYEVAPFTVKISNFFQWFKSSEDYVSSPFFAFDDGYQMILKVTNIKQNLYFSLHVMKDPHDGNL